MASLRRRGSGDAAPAATAGGRQHDDAAMRATGEWMAEAPDDAKCHRAGWREREAGPESHPVYDN